MNLPSSSNCQWHYVEEFIDDDTFQVCPECFHVYQTEQDLLDAHNVQLASMVKDEAFMATFTDLIVSQFAPGALEYGPRSELGNLRYFCGFCIHDF